MLGGEEGEVAEIEALKGTLVAELLLRDDVRDKVASPHSDTGLRRVGVCHLDASRRGYISHGVVDRDEPVKEEDAGFG